MADETSNEDKKNGGEYLREKILELIAAIPAFGIVIPGFLQILDKNFQGLASQLFRFFIVIYFSLPALFVILRILKIRLRNQVLVVLSYLVSIIIATLIRADSWNNWGILIIAFLEVIGGTAFIYRYKNYTARKYTIIFLFLISSASTAIMLFPWKIPTMIQREEKDPIGVFNSAVNSWNKIYTCQRYLDSTNDRINHEDSIETSTFRDRRIALLNLWRNDATSTSEINFINMDSVIDTYPQFFLRNIKRDKADYLVASIFSGIDGTMSEHNSLRRSINGGKLSKAQLAEDSIRQKKIESIREIATGLITVHYIESQKKILEKRLNYDTLRLAELSYQKVFEFGQTQIKLVIKDIRIVGIVIFLFTVVVLFLSKNNEDGDGRGIADSWM